MKQELLTKYTFLLAAGGLLYNILEIFYRGRTHWTMFWLGGISFVALGLINEVLPWQMPVGRQAVIGAGLVTVLELITGCIVNLGLGWNVWDYSNLPGNILGQVAPQYMLLWLPVSLAGIVLDDWLRYWLFGEEHPHYCLRRAGK